MLLVVLCSSAFGVPLAWGEQAQTPSPDDEHQPAENRLEGIREDIIVLRGLIDDQPVEVLAPRGLLGVDPFDGHAVEGRLENLGRALVGSRAELARLADRRETAATPPHSSLDGGVLAPDADTVAPDADTLAPPLASQVEPLTEEELSRLDELELIIERDQLIVTFLSLPVAMRLTALTENNPGLRHVTEELEASAVVQAEAAATIENAHVEERAARAEAASALSEALRQLATERARVEAQRRVVAESRLEYALQLEGIAHLTQDQFELVAEVGQRIEERDFSEADADELYDQVVGILSSTRSDLQEALDTLYEPSRQEPLKDPLDFDSLGFHYHPRESAVLRAARERLEGDVAQFLREEEELRWDRAEALADSISRLGNALFNLLPHLSRAKRERVMGLGDEGIAQLRRELQQLQLTIRWQIYRLPRTGVEILGGAVDLLIRSSTRWDVLILVIVAIGALKIVWRRKQWWVSMREKVRTSVDGQRYAPALDRWLDMVGAIGLPLGLLIVIWLSFRFLGHVSQSPIVAATRSILMGYAWYRLALAAAHHFFINAAEAGPRTVSEKINGKIFRTIRVAGVFLLILYTSHIISSHLLGLGYLHFLMTELFSYGGFLIVYLLLRYWRDDIFDAYINVFAKSALVRRIERYRDKYWSVILLLPAFLSLAGHAAWVYLNETALRFDRTRRGLAYLFRKRLERSRKTRGDVTTSFRHDFPEELIAVFRRDIENRDVLVDHFPRLEKTLELIERWKDGGRGTTIALVGEGGIGKTTWLQELHFRSEVDATVALLEETLVTEDALCRALARAFEMDDADEVDSVDRLVKRISEGPRRLVLLDHCQNLVLRTVGGLGGLGAISRVMARTIGRVFWVCSFSRHLWKHVDFVLRQQSPFRHVVILRGWNDKTLGKLIEKRMASCGIEATYDRMMADEGIGLDHPDREGELERTRERFLRLLWDYTDGVPRAAMHYWLHSLVLEEEGTVNVGLFDTPDADQLDRLQDQGRFMLHTVVNHENITVDEASRVLGYSRDLCLALLELLRAEGYIKRSRDRYRVTVHWGPEVLRFLRRKNLLPE